MIEHYRDFPAGRRNSDGKNSTVSEGSVSPEFFALFTQHARQLYRYIRTLVPNHADAEDAFQDASAVLWQKFDEYQAGSNFMAWASQVARWCVVNQRRRQRRGGSHRSDEFFDSVADESFRMFDALEAQHRALADCYQRLSDGDRQLVDQRYREGESVKQLAGKVGRPLRAMYRQLDRIHTALLNCIQSKLRKEGHL
jgi:RNA polymerase sigma-70 factor (ECF subfamily)